MVITSPSATLDHLWQNITKTVDSRMKYCYLTYDNKGVHTKASFLDIPNYIKEHFAENFGP